LDVPLEWVEDSEASPPKAFRWHTDIPWEARPPKFGLLSAQVVPDAGGDTMWVDTAAAYEALSPTMQHLLHGLRVHYKVEAGAMERLAALVDAEAGSRFKAAYAQGVEHPLVRRNPDSGRLALYMAGYWMDHIVGMHRDEIRRRDDRLQRIGIGDRERDRHDGARRDRAVERDPDRRPPQGAPLSPRSRHRPAQPG